MTRLDVALVKRGLTPSRARAQSLISAGVVTLNGKTADKPSLKLSDADQIVIVDDINPYVSRAALKLEHAFKHFDLSPQGRNILDIGASTGGFTEVCLAQGAKHVTAVDVGHGQMASKISSDTRVTNIEGLNAKDITGDITFDWIVSDVSFISLRKALPAAMDLAKPASVIITLIKPQFEVGRSHIGKGGIVTDSEQHKNICDLIQQWFQDQGWQVQGITDSPIQGADGNLEFLLAAQKTV